MFLSFENIELIKGIMNNKYFSSFISIIATVILCKLTFYIFKRFEQSKTLSTLNMDNSNSLLYRFLPRAIVAIIIVLSVVGISVNIFGKNDYLTTILASSGVLTVVLGFAAQESLNNIISGVFIMIFKPFSIGDRISLPISNITGYIEDISLRHTIIRTYHNSRYVIPNSKLNSELIENSNLLDERSGMYLDITIDFNADLDLAMDIVKEIILNHEDVIDIRKEEEILADVPKASIRLRKISLHGYEIRATVWTESVDKSFSVISELQIEIAKAFKLKGILFAKYFYNENV